MLTTISKCDKCDSRADAKDGNALLCTKHWFEIYGANGKFPLKKQYEVTYLPSYKFSNLTRGNL
jgi:hypothetical protein